MINPRPPYSNELYHYGVKGMKWGIRRYQPYPKGYSGKGRYLGSHIGQLNANRIVEKHLANTLTEDQLKRRRNLSIAGAAVGLGGTGLGIYGVLSGKKVNPAIRDIRYRRASANVGRYGKLTVGTGLGFTAISALEAKKYANALKYKKRRK